MASSSSAALFKEQEKFAKRQAEASNFLASTEKRQKVEKPSSQKTIRPKSILNRSKTSSDFTEDFHPTKAASKTRFLKLTNIVEKLQERFLTGQTDPLTLDELIHEFGLIIDASDRHWLASEALLSNEKIDVKRVDDVNRFVYKPPLHLKAPKKIHLLNLIKSRHEKYEGSVTVDDVRDTIPKAKADLIIDNLIKSGEIVKIPNNKREILFSVDRSYNLQVNTEFVHLWRKISVEGLDDKKILEFLETHGHPGLKPNTPRQVQAATKPSKRGGRRPNTLKHNEHVADQLMDYSNPPNTK